MAGRCRDAPDPGRARLKECIRQSAHRSDSRELGKGVWQNVRHRDMLRIQAFYPSCRRTISAVRHQLIDGVRIACELCFDGPVHAISYPAVDAQFNGVLANEAPEPDALHTTPDDHPPRCHLLWFHDYGPRVLALDALILPRR